MVGKSFLNCRRTDAEVLRAADSAVAVIAGSEPEGSVESPQHKVTIAQFFAVGRHAITRWQFTVFVNTTWLQYGSRDPSRSPILSRTTATRSCA